LNLPLNDFAIFGSGPMFAHGLKKQLRDIDVIARGKAWENALNHKDKEKVWSNGTVINFYGQGIQVVRTWMYGGNFKTDELIDNADVVEGIRFVKLECVLAYKREMGRLKDKRHIKVIEKYLNGVRQI